jgi:hypothetical protein
LGSLGSATSTTSLDSAAERDAFGGGDGGDGGGVGGGVGMRIEELTGLDALGEHGFALKSALMIGAASVLVAEASLAEEAAMTALRATEQSSDLVQLCVKLMFATIQEQSKSLLPNAVAVEVKRGTPISEVAIELEKQLIFLQKRLAPSLTTAPKVAFFAIRTLTNPPQEFALLDSCRIYPSSLHALLTLPIE